MQIDNELKKKILDLNLNTELLINRYKVGYRIPKYSNDINDYIHDMLNRTTEYLNIGIDFYQIHPIRNKSVSESWFLSMLDCYVFFSPYFMKNMLSDAKRISRNVDIEIENLQSDDSGVSKSLSDLYTNLFGYKDNDSISEVILNNYSEEEFNDIYATVLSWDVRPIFKYLPETHPNKLITVIDELTLYVEKRLFKDRYQDLIQGKLNVPPVVYNKLFRGLVSYFVNQAFFFNPYLNRIVSQEDDEIFTSKKEVNDSFSFLKWPFLHNVGKSYILNFPSDNYLLDERVFNKNRFSSHFLKSSFDNNGSIINKKDDITNHMSKIYSFYSNMDAKTSETALRTNEVDDNNQLYPVSIELRPYLVERMFDDSKVVYCYVDNKNKLINVMFNDLKDIERVVDECILLSVERHTKTFTNHSFIREFKNKLNLPYDESVILDSVKVSCLLNKDNNKLKLIYPNSLSGLANKRFEKLKHTIEWD